ncbi:SMP-30/gluconolactonase/LRE family protein [Planctomycetota bacterium]
MHNIIRYSLSVVFLSTVIGYAQESPWEHVTAKLIWQTEPVFHTPEAVLYDSQRKVLYVSNFKKTEPNEPSEFLSKLSPDGDILVKRWITGLDRPTGLTIFRDKLYVVERNKLTRINMDTDKIETRINITGADFSNDVAFDPCGIAYVSDNGPQAQTSIFRLSQGRVESWLSSEQVLRPNGLLVDGPNLIAFDNRRKALMCINRADQTMTELASITTNTPAIGDGLIKLANNTYLVTAWGGEAWIVTPQGKVISLLNTKTLTPVVGKRVNNADIGYIPHQSRLIIPTFFDNRLLAYELSKP